MEVAASTPAGASALPPGATEDAHRTVEELFQQRSVEDIRDVVSVAWAEVDRKKEELRQVVGASYRDFIDSADSIDSMRDATQRVVHNLETIANQIRDLGSTLERGGGASSSGVAAAADDAELPLGIRLFALGSRAKLLLDTPEAIYAVLETDKASEAKDSKILSHGARLAARAFVLWQTQGSELSKRFPLLAQQKPQLNNLCLRLRGACVDRLEAPHVDTGLTVDALAALVLIDIVLATGEGGADGGTGLGLFTLWLDRKLVAITKAVNSWESLAQVGRIVKSVVREASQLFAPSKPKENLNVASRCVPDLEGDIWYEALPSHDKELGIWKDYLDRFVKGTAAVPHEDISKLSAAWLLRAQGETKRLGEAHVGSIGSLANLLEAERKIYALVEGAAGHASSSFGEDCLSVVHRKVPLWVEFYEATFLDRAKVITAQNFERLGSDMKDKITGLKSNQALMHEDYKGKLKDLLEAAFGEIGAIFVGCLEFMTLPCDVNVIEKRVSVLQSFLQECCYKLIMGIITHLDATMESVGTSEHSTCEYGVFLSNLCDCLQTHNAPMLDLLFGKPKKWIEVTTLQKKDASAASAFSMDTEIFNAAMVQLVSKLDETSLSLASSALSALPFPKQSDMEGRLQSMSLRSFNVIIDAICDRVEKAMREHLSKDAILTAASVDVHWEATVVKHQDEEGNDVEMKFFLPNTPSSYVFDQLFSIIEELHKARYVKTNGHNLRALAHEISATFFRVISAFLDESGGRILERGVLQMLFDVRYLFDVLAGGSVHPSASKLMGYAGGPKQSSKLEARLSELIDPIDWATYEPYLWSNEVQYYHRSQLLLNDLIALERVHHEKDVKVASTRSNIIDMSSNVPRFNYLPISTPSLLKIETADDILNLLSGAGSTAISNGSGFGENAHRKTDSSDGGKGSIFSGLLSERAAEATAMAQDLFSGGMFAFNKK